MASHYYVNDKPQSNGDHEVHEDGCYWLGLVQSKTYLGYLNSCREAVTAAKKVYWQSNGCRHCSPACHTG